MAVFISYSRHDETAVRTIAEDLRRAREEVWLDQNLTGGEAWWSAILDQIRSCTVFVFALSESSLQSKPCRAELEYARALGVPVLPVQVGEVQSYRVEQIFSLQLIDYRNPTSTAGIALISAVRDRGAQRDPLPEPLPGPPPVPYEYLQRLGQAVHGPQPIPYDEQGAVVAQLRNALYDELDEGVRNDVRGLLSALRSRPEIAMATASQIDALLGERLPGSVTGPSPPGPVTAPAPAPVAPSAQPAADAPQTARKPLGDMGSGLTQALISAALIVLTIPVYALGWSRPSAWGLAPRPVYTLLALLLFVAVAALARTPRCRSAAIGITLLGTVVLVIGWQLQPSIHWPLYAMYLWVFSAVVAWGVARRRKRRWGFGLIPSALIVLAVLATHLNNLRASTWVNQWLIDVGVFVLCCVICWAFDSLPAAFRRADAKTGRG